MDEGTIIHTGGATLGIILIAMGIKDKLMGYIIPGFLWLLANLFFLLYSQHKIQLNLNKHLFAILFMAIPAFVMGPIVISSTYKYNHQFLRYFVLFVIFVDLVHLFQSSKEVFVICIIIFFLVRRFRLINYDDVHQNIVQNEEYIKKSDILFVIPDYENVKITDDKIFVNKLKTSGKILGMHGVTHEPSSYTQKAEFGLPVSEKKITEGMKIFENAFGYKPKFFKAPCYNLLPENKVKIEKLGMTVIGPETLMFNRLLHPSSNNFFMQMFNFINSYI
uniref:NodB homology domain-containing protein n=1 Tax=viral metagenome TaxID=1070528 RepID=A0A6C0KQ03_9ZZZZ